MTGSATGGGRSARRLAPRTSRVVWITPAVTVVAVAAILLWPRGGVSATAGRPAVTPPSYVREFGATGPGVLVQPVGVVVDGARVYVVDAGRREVIVFSTGGAYQRAFGAGRLMTPLYAAINPLDGRLYVSDRGLAGIAVFGVDGTFVRMFAPDPTDAAAKAAVAGWQPLAVAFAADGSLLVTDSGARQRVLRFGPTGKLTDQTGDDVPPGATGSRLSFANGIAASGDRVLVSDSNNARVLELSRSLRFVRATPFDGLPRGMVALGGGLDAVLDAIGGGIAVLDGSGAVVSRAPSGSRDRGHLAQPTAVALDRNGLLFVSDAGMHRVSVWRSGSVRPTNVLLSVVTDPRTLAAVAVALVGAFGTWWAARARRRVGSRYNAVV